MIKYAVCARYDEQETPEPSRCITTALLDDEHLALLTADQLAEGQTTDVALLVHGEIVELFQWKGVDWFMVEKLDREHPGWVRVDRVYGRNVLQMPGDTVVHAVHRIMAYTHDGDIDSVQVTERRMAIPVPSEEAPQDGNPPRDRPMAA